LNYAFPGTGRLLKSGTGAWALTVANTFTGPTTVSAGVLNLQHGSALGGTANGTVVENNARLELQGNITVAGEPLTISGKGGASFYNGALNSKSGSNAWTGPVTLGANETRIGAESGATLMVSGVIDDAGQTNSLVVRSTDSTSRVILSGANTYQGATWLIAGNLQLVGGNSRLPSGTTLVLGGAGEVQLDFNGCHQEISGLATNGTTPSNLTNSSAGLVNLTVNSPLGQPSLYPGRIVGNIALTKNGPEVVKLTGTNTFTGGTTIVQGALLLNSPGLLASVVTLSGGVFGGNGTVDAPLTVNGGTHAPGDFVGVMTVNSNYTLNAGGSLQVKMFGPTPGTQYDQLRVNGSGSLIKLAGTLQILSTNDLPAGTNFVIISNAGSNPVNGAFAGHPQGSAFVVSNNWFRINYAGGDGNDVVLACIAKPAAPMVYLGWTNRQPYLTTASLTNVNYQILISTNLANWNPIFTTNPSDQPLIWNDTQASNGAGRFYRISIGQ
jgi:autotransporter-associated beta strand protein